MRFRKEVFHRPIESRAADESAVLVVCELLCRFKVRNLVDRPNEPNLFSSLFLVKSEPALLRNIDRLAARNQRQTIVGGWRGEQYVERRRLTVARRAFVKDVKMSV